MKAGKSLKQEQKGKHIFKTILLHIMQTFCSGAFSAKFLSDANNKKVFFSIISCFLPQKTEKVITFL